MLDTETPTPPQTPESSNKLDADIDESLMLANQAGEQARFDAQTDESIDLSRQAREAAGRVSGIDTVRPNHTLRNTTAVLTLAASAGLLIAADQAGQAMNAPKPEGETTITVEGGDTLDGIIAGIPGSGKYDVNEMELGIEGNPANIDVLKDGLQPGESLVVPIEYK